MTMLVRDEDDILEADLSLHRAVGVDHFIVMDHLSTDGARDDAKAAAARGAMILCAITIGIMYREV